MLTLGGGNASRGRGSNPRGRGSFNRGRGTPRGGHRGGFKIDAMGDSAGNGTNKRKSFGDDQ